MLKKNKMLDNNSNSSKSLNELDFEDSESIDLVEFKNILFRNKKFVFAITLLGLLLGSFYAFTREQIWKGQLQIVISDKNNSSAESLNLQNLSKASNILKSRSNIKTQVEILKSPSLLIPIFQKVKSYKSDKGINVDKFRYRKWYKNNVNINLKKDTFVLDVFYKDTDKQLILPTLEHLSSTYQSYVNKGRKKQANARIEFLSNQVKIFKKKSDNSFRKAQFFAFENDISILNKNQPGDIEFDKPIKNTINNSTSSANQIRKLSQQLDKLDAASAVNSSLSKNIIKEEKGKITNIEKTRISSALAMENINSDITRISLAENNLQLEQVIRSIDPISIGLIELDRLDKELIKNRGIYKENDLFIQTLVNQRNNLIKQLKEKSLATLQSQLISEQAKIDAASRPKGVISKYKELVRDADYDLNVYLVLQKELRDIKIKSSENSYPWELITEPTLLEYPVYPEKKKIVMFFFFMGLFLAIISSYIIENKKGIIFSSKKLKKLLRGKVFEYNNNLKENENIQIMKLFINSIESKKEDIYLLPIGSIADDEINTLKNKILKDFPKGRILVTRDLNQSLNSNNQISICKLAAITRKDLLDFENKLQLQGNNIKGSILIT